MNSGRNPRRHFGRNFIKNPEFIPEQITRDISGGNPDGGIAEVMP